MRGESGCVGPTQPETDRVVRGGERPDLSRLRVRGRPGDGGSLTGGPQRSVRGWLFQECSCAGNHRAGPISIFFAGDNTATLDSFMT